MFKRPSQRISCPPPVRGDKPIPGTLIYDISTQKPTKQFIFHKGSVYKEADYIEALKKNHQNLGIPYIEPNLPRLTPYHEPLRIKEPEILYGDRIQVTLRVLKNGTARVKVNGAIAMMYDKYYHRGVQAPIKVILQAYKSHGFSDSFLEKIKKSYARKIAYTKKVPGILQKIFDKEPVKKIKIKKKKEIEDEEEPEPEVEEDDIPTEEGELDVEPDDPEEVVEEEEYMSDLET
jgi:hypothetical protein